MDTADSGLPLYRLLLDTPPAVLYHYTTMEGLLGIVQSENIRASDSRYLNDATDCAYLLQLLKERLLTRLENAVPSDRKYYEDLLSSFESSISLEWFVASFSEVGDSLSQWRAYSSGGIGFSIGFDASAFHSTFVRDASHESIRLQRRLSRIRYLRGNGDIYIDQMLQASSELSKSLLDVRLESLGSVNWPVNWPVQISAMFLNIFAPIFKHSAFEEEREWRLTLSKIGEGIPARRFRVGKSTLIPYVEARPQMNEGYFIKEVIVGPTPQRDLSIKAVQGLFESVNHPEVIVRTSSAPYRHW